MRPEEATADRSEKPDPGDRSAIPVLLVSTANADFRVFPECPVHPDPLDLKETEVTEEIPDYPESDMKVLPECRDHRDRWDLKELENPVHKETVEHPGNKANAASSAAPGQRVPLATASSAMPWPCRPTDSPRRRDLEDPSDGNPMELFSQTEAILSINDACFALLYAQVFLFVLSLSIHEKYPNVLE